MYNNNRWLIETSIVLVVAFVLLHGCRLDPRYRQYQRPNPIEHQDPDPLEKYNLDSVSWNYSITHREAVVVSSDPMEHLLDAIWKVESSGQFNPKDGDGGNAVTDRSPPIGWPACRTQVFG